MIFSVRKIGKNNVLEDFGKIKKYDGITLDSSITSTVLVAVPVLVSCNCLSFFSFILSFPLSPLL